VVEDMNARPVRKGRSLDPESRYRHGTRARYVDGCRWDDCRMANRVYLRQYRWNKNGRRKPGRPPKNS